MAKNPPGRLCGNGPSGHSRTTISLHGRTLQVSYPIPHKGIPRPDRSEGATGPCAEGPSSDIAVGCTIFPISVFHSQKAPQVPWPKAHHQTLLWDALYFQ